MIPAIFGWVLCRRLSGGCAQILPLAVAAAMPATLQLTHRTIGAGVRRRTYDVVVDGTTAGVVTVNETIELAVEPGRHIVQVRSGRNSSGVATFEIADGGVVRFRGGGKSTLPKFLPSFVVPSWALTLRRE